MLFATQKAHMNPDCKALTFVAINAICKLSVNAMMLCNTTVEQNEGDNFFWSKGLASLKEKSSVTSKFGNFDVGENLKHIEKGLTDHFGKKIGNAMKTTFKKVDNIFFAVVAAEIYTKF